MIASNERALLRADCARCAGLCCVLPPFAASADFAVDKPAGRVCPHLAADDRCGIHRELGERGFGGCVVFDCFGAGQHMVQVTYGGVDPRAEPGALAVFDALRRSSEMLWYLAEAVAQPGTAALHGELTALRRAVRDVRAAQPAELARIDLDALHLVGARLPGADLRADCLRCAWLLGADLRGADLRGADLLGADLRGCDLRGADLREALFLTRPQVAAARTDSGTRLPAVLTTT